MNSIQIIKKIPLFRIILKENTLGYCANIDLLEFKDKTDRYEKQHFMHKLYSNAFNSFKI